MVEIQFFPDHTEPTQQSGGRVRMCTQIKTMTHIWHNFSPKGS